MSSNVKTGPQTCLSGTVPGLRTQVFLSVLGPGLRPSSLRQDRVSDLPLWDRTGPQICLEPQTCLGPQTCLSGTGPGLRPASPCQDQASDLPLLSGPQTCLPETGPGLRPASPGQDRASNLPHRVRTEPQTFLRQDQTLSRRGRRRNGVKNVAAPGSAQLGTAAAATRRGRRRQKPQHRRQMRRGEPPLVLPRPVNAAISQKTKPGELGFLWVRRRRPTAARHGLI